MIHAIRIAAILSAASIWTMTAWGQTTSPADAPNLVSNSGFEAPAAESSPSEGWHGSAKAYARDESVARTGRASLRFSNADAALYETCTLGVSAKPGCKYRFGAFVKTKEIAGADSGATVCMEWYDAEGKYLGGAYPEGVKGTADWTRVSDMTRVPAGAASVAVACYVRKGMTGTAWFDDVEVVRVRDPLLTSFVAEPVYRGRIGVGEEIKVRLRVTLNLSDWDHRLADLRLSADLRAKDDPTVLCSALARPTSPECDLVLLRAALAPGDYLAEVVLTDAAGTALARQSHPVHRLGPEFKPRAYIDRHLRMIVDGESFFPLGMYFSDMEEKDLRLYADSRFNCLMPYGRPTRQQMDLAAGLGLKVIYSLKDLYAGSKYCPASIRSTADEERSVRSTVRDFRDHPALLGWYLNDELPPSYLPRLTEHYQWLCQDDPNHPTWVVLCQPEEFAAYAGAFDVIGSDPYPIGREAPSMAGRWTQRTVRAFDSSRPVWMVPQVFNWSCYPQNVSSGHAPRTPTLEEMRSMAWQCICEGATGLIFYSFFDVKRAADVPFEQQWERLRTLAAEIDAAAPVLLSVEQVEPIKVEAPGWLHWIAKKRYGRLYIYAVNDGDGEGQVTFTLSAPPNRVLSMPGGQAVETAGATFRDSFRRLEVKSYAIEMH